MRRTLPLWLCSLALAGSLSAQEPPDSPPAAEGDPAVETADAAAPADSEDAFPSGVDLVTVDVVVVDDDGQPVVGLEQGDFSIYEDGDLQTITSFEAVVLPESEPEPEDAAVAPTFTTNRVPERKQGRTFVVLFDDIHLSPAQAMRAKVAVHHFLKTGTRAGDRVSLIATGGSAWWNAEMPAGMEDLVTILHRLDGRFIPDSSPDRVTDWEAMRIMTFDDPDVAYTVQRRFDAYGTVGRERVVDREYADVTRTTSAVGLIDPYVRARAQDTYQQAVTRRRITMDVMTRAINALTGVQGRKAFVLVSQGFIYEPNFDEMKEVVEASLRVNIPVYFIDTRGLQAMPAAMTAEFPSLFDVQDTVAVLADIGREAEGSEAVALDTGGFVIKNTNDLESGILRVSNESLAFYLLGYTSTNTERDGKFRKIEVELDRSASKDRKVRARRGYYAPEEGGRRASRQPVGDPAITRALDSPMERREIPLRVGAFTFDESLMDRARVLLTTEVDIRGLELSEEDGRFKDDIAFLIEMQHGDSGEIYNYDQKIEMRMLPETRDRLERTWYPVSREFDLEPGSYQAKVVVRDLTSGRLGSVIHNFDVPALGGLRVSTPILADALIEAEPGDTRPPRPVLQVRREFTPESMLYVQYSVFGAEKDLSTLMPRVSGGYEIRRSDGSILKAVVPTPIEPTSLGFLIRLHGISLLAAEPGLHELVLKVRDEISGEVLERSEAFLVREAPPRSAAR